MKEEEKNLRFDQLNFAVEKSIRYNRRRSDHYKNIDMLFRILIVLFGSASFLNIVSSYIPHHDMFILIVVIIGVADLVLGLGNRSTEHAVLQRRFTDLASDMRKMKEFSDQQLREWADIRLQIETDEPAPFCALEAFCDNEVSIAWGWHTQNGVVPLSWWQRRMMSWIKFDKTQLPDRILLT